MSKTKTAKRVKVWQVVWPDGSLALFEFNGREDAERTADRNPDKGRVVRLIEVRPGDVVLSREDVEELRRIASSPMLLTYDRDRAIDILRGRR